MRTTLSTVIAASIAISLALFGCVDATSACGGGGETVRVNGASYCVYKQSIVIVGGFECPASMPFRIDFEGATVCGQGGFDDIDVPEDICARVFVPCTEPEQSDGGVAPMECGGQPCVRANAATRCSTEGACLLGACALGFDDCDGNPGNGCETSLESPDSCGSCGNQCDTPWCQAGECLLWPPIGPLPDAGRNDASSCPAVEMETCDAIDNDCDGIVDESVSAIECALPNGESLCSMGACLLTTCNEGFGNCDNQAANGCETALTTLDNCGACGVVCAGLSMTCSTGECRVDTLP